jgi:hypothetical protein
MQAIRMQRAGLKGAIWLSQGCPESPYSVGVSAMSMQKPCFLQGEMWCQRDRESFKACFVYGS